MRAINYIAEPTPARMHASDDFVRGIMGPLGSGKSVACTMEITRRAMQQRPDRNGMRRTRWAVIRNTYPELRSTTINTWVDWVPESVCPIIYTTPITGHMLQRLADDTTMDMTVYFLSIDSAEDVGKLLSMELTGGWINEARQVPKAALDMLTGRVGRFPKKDDFEALAEKECPITWSGVVMDTNPPDDDHWWYRYAELGEWKKSVEQLAEMIANDPTLDIDANKIANWSFYRQPGALQFINGKYKVNPLAENVKHQSLGYTYWLRQMAGKAPEWIRAYIMGEYATVFEGRPVYDRVWVDAWHRSPKPLTVYPGLPLRLGWDFGLTPACVVGQVSPQGQVRILREYVCEYGGLKQFAETVVKPALMNQFPGMALISVCDPAGIAKSQTDETTCLDILAAVGIPTHLAQTQKFQMRREAVIAPLQRMIGGEPGFILDPSCRVLRKGFNGGYQFSRVRASKPDSVDHYCDEPEKNDYSHPHDALQYFCVDVEYGVGSKEVQRHVGTAVPDTITNWNGYT